MESLKVDPRDQNHSKVLRGALCLVLQSEAASVHATGGFGVCLGSFPGPVLGWASMRAQFTAAHPTCRGTGSFRKREWAGWCCPQGIAPLLGELFGLAATLSCFSAVQMAHALQHLGLPLCQ